MKNNNLFLIGIAFLILVVSQFLFIRFDGTSKNKNTLGNQSIAIINKVEKPLVITIFLDGSLTGDYKILQDEIDFFLKDIREINSNIEFKFSDPNKNRADFLALEKARVKAINLPIQEGFLSIYPFAKIEFNHKQSFFSVLINNSIPIEERAIPTINNIEYIFIKQIASITSKEKKNIGILTHHSELLPIYRYGLESELIKNYNLGIIQNERLNSQKSFDFDDIETLKQFDALLVLKPVEPFSNKDKIVLDQYMMNGGRMLLAMETVDAEMDSLYTGDKIVAFPRDLNMTDWLFNYGIRIKRAIVKDLQSSTLVLAVGEVAGNIAYNNFPWPYFPIVTGKKHPIGKDLNSVKLEFANPLEVLNNNEKVKSHILLSSSDKSSLQEPLSYIDFSIINNINPSEYTLSNIPLAILVEGNFESAYKNRIESKSVPTFKSSVQNGKIIVISDGDIAKNHTIRGQPIPLGADKYSHRGDKKDSPLVTFANLEFLKNCIDYLVDDNQLVSLKKNESQFGLLNKSVVDNEKGKWQILNIIVPIFFIIFISSIFFLLKKNYLLL